MGSAQGSVLYNIRNGWPKHFGHDCSSEGVRCIIVMSGLNCIGLNSIRVVGVKDG